MSDRFLPEPDVAPLVGGPVLRWGVLGPGDIANDFTATLHANTDQRVTAVASRSAERARAFAARHGIDRATGSVEELLGGGDVDVVYVAAPHPAHLPLALAAVEAGLPVLVEKPLAMSAEEGRRLADAARAAEVFAGEAMWTAYLPQTSVLRQVLDRGDLGDVRLATADVGWRAEDDPDSRLRDPDQGGGTVLDAGVYGLWFAQLAIGRPVDVRAVGDVSGTGVDEQAVVSLRGAHGALASVTSTMAGTSTGLASIVGTAGSVRFTEPFVFPAAFTVQAGASAHEWRDPDGLALRDGLAWQATAVAAMIAEGRLDSPVHPIADAVGVLSTIDAVRQQVLAADLGNPT